MYNKLFTKILDSSIWLERTPTRIVWLTFIAAMDSQGFAQFASIANLAHRAIVTPEEAEEAVKTLEAPDTDSSDPEHDGRRIERVPGGWMVLNAEKYRQLVTRVVQQEQTRERVRRFRARHKVTGNGSNDEPLNVTPSEAYAEADQLTPPSPLSGGRFTRKEIQHATLVRKNRFGCQHQPHCESPNICVRLIAQEIRDRAEGDV